MKETEGTYEGIIGCNCKMTPILREPFSDRYLIWLPSVFMNINNPVGSHLAQSETLEGQFQLFTVLRVCITYSSLCQRARGNLFEKHISIPNRGGHWS